MAAGLLVQYARMIQRDVYTPSLSAAPVLPLSSKPPILLFLHGGSFTHGGRIWQHRDLIHANLGAFFAIKGIVTVVVDYRLVPSVTYPGGSENTCWMHLLGYPSILALSAIQLVCSYWDTLRAVCTARDSC